MLFPLCTPSGPARKRPRPLEEAVEAGDGVSISFSPSFAADNQSLVLLQVRNWHSVRTSLIVIVEVLMMVQLYPRIRRVQMK